ncbi:MAG: N-acetyl-gamma-glutamyl-phosphate reductase [Anaerolineales bacterium]|nr:N-acetyl-gamma-glutamyl-phosphate reductase [Anaerolineales bacterium]
MRTMLKAGIFGATGYTGFRLVDIVRRHPEVEIGFATSERSAGSRLSDVFACPWDIALIAAGDAPLDEVDAAFLCLPHGASIPAVQRVVEAGVRAIDLSADFRLSDPQVYEQWYNTPHTATDLLAEAVYGLPELHREAVAGARLVANPGCYPTSVILGLYPLAKQNLISGNSVIVDSKSGVSGAGRGLSLKTHFVEAHANFSPYNIGHQHRHIPEMEAELSAALDRPLSVTFSPHLLPTNQGILSTMYVTLVEPWSESELLSLYGETYAGEPFVHVLPAGDLATLRHVVNTNRCTISLTLAGEDQLIVCAAIDNLIKGASGQAVQNFNVMFGLEETTGLET